MIGFGGTTVSHTKPGQVHGGKAEVQVSVGVGLQLLPMQVPGTVHTTPKQLTQSLPLQVSISVQFKPEQVAVSEMTIGEQTVPVQLVLGGQPPVQVMSGGLQSVTVTV
jgi:hypothetical protein